MSCGTTYGHSKLHVASGQWSQPLAGHSCNREPGQKVTHGQGRTGLDPESPGSSAGQQEGLPCPDSPAPAQNQPPTSPPLLPTALLVQDPGKAPRARA